MDWSKTRKLRVSPFRDTPPVYVRTFSESRASDISLHALLSLHTDPDRMVTVVGSSTYVEKVKDILGEHKIRLMNLQKAVHAKHQGLLLVAEPKGQADLRKMFDLIESIKEDTVRFQEIA